ncbi:MAG: histidine kinase [Bacteroidota bacterium]
MLINRFHRSLILFIILSILIKTPVFSQEPAHAYWGQKELSGADIYDVFQDSKGIYWLTTNSGIFKYDGRKFQDIPTIDSKSVSFFNLLEGPDGHIYCNNLSGQIYVIQNDAGTLYYQMPDSLISSNMLIRTDNDGDLIFQSNKIVRLDSEKQLSVLYHSGGLSDLYKSKSGTLLYFDFIRNKLVKITAKKTTVENVENNVTQGLLLMFEKNDSLYMFDKLAKKLHCIVGNKLKRIKTNQDLSRVMEFKSFGDEYWSIDMKSGACAFRSDGSKLYNGNKLFENEFISAGFYDREGNILLGTFGSGLIFIPASAIENFFKTSANQKSRRISLAPNNNLFVGTLSGEVYVVNEKGVAEQVLELSKSSLEFMRWFPSQNQLVLSSEVNKKFTPAGYGLEGIRYEYGYYFVGAVKDIVEFRDNTFLVASSRGPVIYDPDETRPAFMKDYTEIREHKYRIPGIKGRSHKVGYNKINKIIYCATTNGIKYIIENGDVKEITLDGKSLLGRSFMSKGDLTYIGTQYSGILVVKAGEIIDQWTDVSAVEAILPLGEFLLTSTDSGLKVKDSEGNTVKSYGLSDGLFGKKIKDVIVQGDIIWAEHQKGIQKIKWNADLNKYEIPELSIAELTVNEKTVPLSRNEFSYDETRFQYELLSNSMRMKEEIYYQYQLEGLDEDWQTVSFYENKIEYKSLPPGNYNFKVKMLFREQNGPEVTHSFTVLLPFYQTWWFYLLSTVTVILVIWFIFNYQLKSQKEKDKYLNELNEQKLKALRSQMNPHFMFNALNSIQEYIMLNERKLAAKYLGKFADLMRIYLNHSRTDYISLSEEIAAIYLYLDLEKLRFQETLSYEVEVSEEVDSFLISIPSMLLQPYIENALKHGLLHKKDNRKLIIRFRMEGTDILNCEVLDNGVGRNKSMEINRMRNPGHRSFASSATKRRLDLLNNNRKRDITEEIEDLYDVDGNATGTRVNLHIPWEDL